MANGVPILLLTALGAAAAGAIGTLAVQRLLPEPRPGDGFTVRWLADDGTEKRLEYGQDEKGALERALELKPKYPDVAVIEVRQGIVIRVTRANVRVEV